MRIHLPRVVTSDNGSKFNNMLYTAIQNIGISCHMTARYLQVSYIGSAQWLHYFSTARHVHVWIQLLHKGRSQMFATKALISSSKKVWCACFLLKHQLSGKEVKSIGTYLKRYLKPLKDNHHALKSTDMTIPIMTVMLYPLPPLAVNNPLHLNKVQLSPTE